MNEPVAAYLDDYLDGSVAGRGAVLLTGPWGGGKTFFVRSYLERRRKALLKKEPLNKLTHLYVSLYGVRSTDEVQELFFAQTNPVLGSAPARLVGTGLTRAANAATRSQIFKDTDAKVLRKFFGRDLTEIPLVFDDLERCEAPLGEIMGFINGFVEHDGAKVIILANEDELPKEKSGEDFQRRKEKLIGKTLRVEADPAAAYALWAKHLRSAAACKAAQANEHLALEVFRSSKIGNLRSLRAVLDDFDRLVANVDPRLGESPPAVSRLLAFMLATGLEHRANKLDVELLPRFSALRMEQLMLSVSRRSEPSDDAKLVAAIADKHPNIEWSDSVVPPDALVTLFKSGVIQREAIDPQLARHPLIVPPSAAPSWRRLWNWPELGTVEYAEVRATLLDELANRRVRHPGPILHSAGLILALRLHNDDLLAGAPASEYFRRYVDDLLDTDALEPRQDVFDMINLTGFGGLAYFERESSEFREIRTHLVTAVATAVGRRAKAQAPALLERLRTGASAYSTLYEPGRGDPDFGSVPVLHHLPVADFADLLLGSGGVPDDKLFASLRERYLRRHDGKLRAVERSWLDDVRTEVDQRVAALPPPHHSWVAGRVEYWWKEVDGLASEQD